MTDVQVKSVMQREADTRRRSLVLTLVGCLLLLSLTGCAAVFAWKKQTAATASRDRAADVLLADQTAAEQVKHQGAAPLKLMLDAATSTDELLPASSDALTFFSVLSEVSKHAGVKWVSGPTTVGTAPAGLSSLKQQGTITGSLPAVHTFLEQVDAAPALITLTDATYSQNGGAWTVQFTANLFAATSPSPLSKPHTAQASPGPAATEGSTPTPAPSNSSSATASTAP